MKETTSFAQIPHTQQGLLDYIRYAKAEIKSMARRQKSFNAYISYCETQLIIKGHIPNQTNQQEIPNAQHV